MDFRVFYLLLFLQQKETLLRPIARSSSSVCHRNHYAYHLSWQTSLSTPLSRQYRDHWSRESEKCDHLCYARIRANRYGIPNRSKWKSKQMHFVSKMFTLFNLLLTSNIERYTKICDADSFPYLPHSTPLNCLLRGIVITNTITLFFCSLRNFLQDAAMMTVPCSRIATRLWVKACCILPRIPAIAIPRISSNEFRLMKLHRDEYGWWSSSRRSEYTCHSAYDGFYALENVPLIKLSEEPCMVVCSEPSCQWVNNHRSRSVGNTDAILWFSRYDDNREVAFFNTLMILGTY